MALKRTRSGKRFQRAERLIGIDMGTLVDFSKLAELRARTDRDLVCILNADLERALAFAGVAATRHSVFRSQAEIIYKRAKALLPKLFGAAPDDVLDLEAKLKELGMALDLVPGTMDLEEGTAAACGGNAHVY